jgi:hypothetical protein
MQAAALSIAAGESLPRRRVSWPSRTTSFSRARNANESLAAASTTASFIEFEPMSIAASFNPGGTFSVNLSVSTNAPHCIEGVLH